MYLVFDKKQCGFISKINYALINSYCKKDLSSTNMIITIYKDSNFIISNENDMVEKFETIVEATATIKDMLGIIIYNNVFVKPYSKTPLFTSVINNLMIIDESKFEAYKEYGLIKEIVE